MNPDRIPPLVKDYYWDKQDCPIPYTEAAMQFKKKTYRGSADDMKVPEDKCHMVLPEIEEEAERRGSLTTNRRGSRLSDIILMQEKRKARKGRYRDKQGFTWRPFNPQDEELPVPRAP